MTVKIYEMDLYDKALSVYPEYEWMAIDEFIRKLGFKSCKFISKIPDTESYWEMDEVEFTWFALKYSG